MFLGPEVSKPYKNQRFHTLASKAIQKKTEIQDVPEIPKILSETRLGGRAAGGDGGLALESLESLFF